MLRITLNEQEGKTPELILEGRLVGPWVSELRSAVAAARSVSGNLNLDLSGMHFVDTEGLTLLHSLSDQGVALRNATPFIQELFSIRLDELTVNLGSRLSKNP